MVTGKVKDAAPGLVDATARPTGSAAMTRHAQPPSSDIPATAAVHPIVLMMLTRRFELSPVKLESQATHPLTVSCMLMNIF